MSLWVKSANNHRWFSRLKVVLVAGISTALVMHFFFSKSLPKNAIEQRALVLSLFDTGKDGFAKTQEIHQACPETKDHLWIFCQEGYFYQKALSNLKDPAKSLEEIVKEQFSLVKNSSLAVTGTWGIAFGIAYGRNKNDISHAADAFSSYPKLLFKYFVDGWALAYAEQNGGQQTLIKCKDALGEEFVETCAWGIGRSIFFGLPPDADQMIQLPKVKAGFDFASTFTFPDIPETEVISLVDSAPQKMAEITKRLAIEPHRAHADFSYFYLCFQKHHFSGCD